MRSFRYTLSPENAALWERFLLPSFAQHLPAKRFDCSVLAESARVDAPNFAATEPVDLADEGTS